MTGAEVLDVGRDAIWLTLQLCAPCLIVGLVIGVAIGFAYYRTADTEGVAQRLLGRQAVTGLEVATRDAALQVAGDLL